MRPFSEFRDELNAKMRAEKGWARYTWDKLLSRVMVRWRLRLHYWLHPEALRYVSPEALAAFTPEDIAETQAAIAMEARRGETENTGSTAKGGDSAGAKHIAQPQVPSP